MTTQTWPCYSYPIFIDLCVLCVTVLTMDVQPQKETYVPDYHTYHNLSSIGMIVDKFVHQHPDIVRYHSTYLSRQGRSQIVLEIRNFTRNLESVHQSEIVRILLSYGEHAREFLPVESLFYLLKQITQSEKTGYLKYSNSEKIDLNKLHILVIVMGNPDGRRYVENTKNYCWRGTSSGVDLNRNFEWEFGGKGSSANKKDEEYRGQHVFSEPETGVYRELTKLVKFDAFVSLHSGIRQIYIPYADSRSRQIGRVPDNEEAMLKLAKVLSTSTKHEYQFGKAADLNDYSADGTVFDYMAGVKKIPFSYAIELWGPDKHKGTSCFDLFNPPNHNLQTVIEEIYPLYKTLFDWLIQWKMSSTYSQSGSSNHGNNSRIIHSPHHPDILVSDENTKTVNKKDDVPSLTPGYILLFAVVIVTALVSLHGRYPVCRRMVQRRRVVSLRSLSTTFSTSVFRT